MPDIHSTIENLEKPIMKISLGYAPRPVLSVYITTDHELIVVLIISISYQ